jgi:hypothetical protein
MRKHTAAVDIGHQDHRAIDCFGKAHVGDVARAQALQARAAGLEPHTDMNPVLLKPSSDTGAQVIIHGRVRADMNARDYHQYKTIAMAAVLESHQRLLAQYEVVMVEGAGSPAARACNACARPISPPSDVTALFKAMFCGLNGTTRTPARASSRHSAATTVDLPASEVVPCTINVR